MEPILYKGHRFPPEMICQAVWLYFRFTLSLRDVEELLAQRSPRAGGLNVPIPLRWSAPRESNLLSSSLDEFATLPTTH